MLKSWNLIYPEILYVLTENETRWDWYSSYGQWWAAMSSYEQLLIFVTGFQCNFFPEVNHVSLRNCCSNAHTQTNSGWNHMQRFYLTLPKRPVGLYSSRLLSFWSFGPNHSTGNVAMQFCPEIDAALFTPFSIVSVVFVTCYETVMQFLCTKVIKNQLT